MYSFPTEVVVTMEKVEDHPSPPEEFRKKMMPAVKDFFGEKLEEETWTNLGATLWYAVQPFDDDASEEKTPLQSGKWGLSEVQNKD